MEQNNKVVILLSGGIDSTVLLYWLEERNYEIFPLIVNYGQITFASEYKHSVNILKHLDINKLFNINISDISQIGKGSLLGEYPEDVTSYSEWYSKEFFPNRNLILLTLASSYAYKIKANNVAIGVVGESYKDTSLDFLNNVAKCLNGSLMSINIIAPFAGKERKEVIDQAIYLNVPLKKTFSCNALSDRHCHLCRSCYERELALRRLPNI